MLLVGRQQRFNLGLLFFERRLFLAELHLLQAPQAAQAGVEHVIGLRLVHRKAHHQALLGIVVVAHDADDLVEIEEDDDHA